MTPDATDSPVDLVLPVHNDLNRLRDSLATLLATASDRPFRLFIIDDGSDSTTAAFLEEEAARHPELVLQRNPRRQGPAAALNQGAALATAPFVVLLAAPLIFPPAWLSRLLSCAESDPGIVAVSPLGNHLAPGGIPLVPGTDYRAMDDLLRRRSPRSYPEMIGGGSCLLLRRSVSAESGPSIKEGPDPLADLCRRLVASGHRVAVADNLYLFDPSGLSCRSLPRRRISPADPLERQRQLLQLPQRWDPLPVMRETWRRMRDHYRRRFLPGIGREAWRGTRSLAAARRQVVGWEELAPFRGSGRLRVTYLLSSLTVAGGVLSVVQLVNELILLGVEARIVTLREYPEIYDWNFLGRPLVFRNRAELLANFPPSDVAVATLWLTAPWVAELVRSGTAGAGAYFIQDYESWFYPPDSCEAQAVRNSYRLLPHRIVKSEWLKNLLYQDGYSAKKIPLGMDLATFYPREPSRRSSRQTILAMARPRTPRRGFPDLVEALRRVKADRPDAEIILFGDDLSGREIPFAYRDEGVISDREQLARLYSAADIYLDASTFQGFGRPALEAMACGAACVLTGEGGVNEYARDGENCLLAPPRRPDLLARAMLKILADPELQGRLSAAGLATVGAYCHKREARETLAFFQAITQSARGEGKS